MTYNFGLWNDYEVWTDDTTLYRAQCVRTVRVLPVLFVQSIIGYAVRLVNSFITIWKSVALRKCLKKTIQVGSLYGSPIVK